MSAVLVTFNPDLDELITSVRAVGDQVSDIFIVDNSSTNFSPNWLDSIGVEVPATIHLQSLSDNLGVGAGHNVGIRLAQDIGSQFILILDQDSVVEKNMVCRLVAAYGMLLKEGIDVAAVGPRYRDANNGLLSLFVRVGFFGFTRVICSSIDSVVEADFLVSSGSLIPLKVIKSVGMMDESLFIDHVDTDWCFRAKHQGFKIFGVCGALMTHSLGDRRMEFWFLRYRTAHFHQPFRYYYMLRNSILLYRRTYMPYGWILADIARSLKILFFFGMFSSDRFKCLQMMWRGLVDGLKGISGKKTSYIKRKLPEA